MSSDIQYLSILTAIFQVNLGLLVFIAAKDDGGGGDNWSYKTCKAPVKSSPLTNQHPTFVEAGCHSCRPTNSIKALVKFCIFCRTGELNSSPCQGGYVFVSISFFLLVSSMTYNLHN